MSEVDHCMFVPLRFQEVLEQAQAARATSVAFLQPGTEPGSESVTEPSAEGAAVPVEEGLATAGPLPGLMSIGNGACSVTMSQVDTSPWLVWCSKAASGYIPCKLPRDTRPRARPLPEPQQLRSVAEGDQVP